MNQQNNQSTFLDSKTILAVILVAASWLGWQTYMQKKYPDLYKPEAAKTETLNGKENVASSTGVNTQGENSNVNTADSKAIPSENSSLSGSQKLHNLQPEVVINFSDNTWSFDISSKGMGLKNIVLKKFTDREGQLKTIGLSQGELPFSTKLLGDSLPIDFQIEKVRDNEFVGLAQVGALKIEKRYIIDSQNYSLKTRVLVSHVDRETRFSGIETIVSNKYTKPPKSMGLSHFDHEEIYISGADENVRETLKDEDLQKSISKANLVSVGSQYFTVALFDESSVIPEVKAAALIEKNEVLAKVQYSLLNRNQDFDLKYVAFAGPKSMNILSTIDDSMVGIINFGWFSLLAKYILRLMKLFYEWIGNWGIAIILLTVLVRLIVLPFNLMSMKSMKKMQKIQPQLKAIREKYKNDSQRMNQETMALMKDTGANPLGGCLPMLLQFPVFIALYQVLGQSVELYHAPFFGWIHDLSTKDPFYILPVLMGITMFAQQRLTPSTMDPAQQKIFMFMPIIFSLFMISLPSGLTLYIFTSALFAAIQQFILLKDKTETQAV